MAAVVDGEGAQARAQERRQRVERAAVVEPSVQQHDRRTAFGSPLADPQREAAHLDGPFPKVAHARPMLRAESRAVKPIGVVPYSG
ncbi:MAG: hypothetical protein NVSMB23_26930 [Myxococcales bacterium]